MFYQNHMGSHLAPSLWWLNLRKCWWDVYLGWRRRPCLLWVKLFCRGFCITWWTPWVLDLKFWLSSSAVIHRKHREAEPAVVSVGFRLESKFCKWQAVWPSEPYLTSLCLGFPICKRGNDDSSSFLLWSLNELIYVTYNNNCNRACP